jgi:hypothetical protein
MAGFFFCRPIGNRIWINVGELCMLFVLKILNFLTFFRELQSSGYDV